MELVRARSCGSSAAVRVTVWADPGRVVAHASPDGHELWRCTGAAILGTDPLVAAGLEWRRERDRKSFVVAWVVLGIRRESDGRHCDGIVRWRWRARLATASKNWQRLCAIFDWICGLGSCIRLHAHSSAWLVFFVTRGGLWSFLPFDMSWMMRLPAVSGWVLACLEIGTYRPPMGSRYPGAQ